MENNEVFHFIGRPDGLGNRIEELINIQEFCETNNKKCVYIWNNSQARKYDIFIHFDNKRPMMIVYPLDKISEEEEIEDMEQLLERSYIRLILAPKTDE